MRPVFGASKFVSRGDPGGNSPTKQNNVTSKSILKCILRPLKLATLSASERAARRRGVGPSARFGLQAATRALIMVAAPALDAAPCRPAGRVPNRLVI